MTGHTKLAVRMFYLALVGVLSMGVAANAGGKNSRTSYSATSIIFNGDGATQVYLLQSDLSAGDPAGSAAYSASDANVTDLVGGQWELDLRNQAARKLYLDFDVLTPVAGSAAWPSSILPSGYYSYVALISRCYDAKGNLVDLLSLAGSNNNCMLEIYVAGQDGNDYTLQIGNTGSGAPASGTAQVTCNAIAADGSGCNDWTIAPYLAGGSTDTVAVLTRLSSGPHTNSSVLGSYSGDTFRIHVTRP